MKWLFAGMLFFITLTNKAQDKFDYMSIEYSYDFRQIYVTIDSTFFTEEVELKKKERSSGNNSPFLKKVKYYEDLGWELVSFDAYAYGGPIKVAYLRKRR